MKALMYLICTQTKNRILSLKKKPGLLILYGFVFLIMVISVLFLLLAPDNPNKSYVDIRFIYLFISGFGLLYLFTFTYTGLSTGSTLFTMADVGLLFVAPISSKKILIYGLFSTIGKSMLASLFIFYQIPNLKNMFGFGFKEILALFFIYTVMVIFNQILSIAIYIFSHGNQNRKNLVRLIYGFVGFVAVATYKIFQNEQVSILEAVCLLVDSEWFGYLPAIGWVTMFFKGIISGSLVSVIISLGLFVLVIILCILLLSGREADYYEDVLYSTEISFQRLRDAKEGRNVSANINRKIDIKEKDHGLNKGKGANVFVYKHLLEMKRSSRFLFIDGFTIIATICVGIAAFIIKNGMLPYIILASLIYIQYFLTVFGKLKIELTKPYIYMIPEPSYKKLLAASTSSLLKPCLDLLLIFGVFALVGGAGILDCIFMALAYSASGAVYVGLTIVYQRIFGSQPNMWAKIFIGVFLFLAVFTPAVIASVLITIYVLPKNLHFLATLPYSIICLIFAFIMFFTCRNLIDKTEYSEKMV